MSLVNNESVNHPNKMIPNVYRLGSVKKIRGEEGSTPWLFDFSDHYSLFDWGKMPDELPSGAHELGRLRLPRKW